MAAVLDIMQEILSLPRTDRSYLAKKLIESLEMDDSFTVEELETFKRRSSEIREGSVKPLTLEQLERNVGARLA
jgi:Putative addiction module component